MRHVVGGRASQQDQQAASTSGIGRFETEMLSTKHNLVALMHLSGDWIDKVHQRKPPKRLILDLDSSVSETYGQQEGSAYRLVDNRSTEVGGYDEPQLLKTLIMLSKNGGLEATGYDGEDIDRLFQLLNPDLEEVAVSDEAEKLPRKWKTKVGQAWKIGRQRRIC